MMWYNCPSFSRNDSPSFRTRLCRSTPHSAFPKYIYWQGLRLLEILSQKQFVKRLSSWKRLCLQRIPVAYDQIICFAGVGFLSDGDEQPFRGSIVIEITGKMLPGGIEFVKLYNEKVTSPLVTVGYNWDVNHVKTCLVKVTCMSGRQEKFEGTRPRQAQWQSQWIQSSLRAANNHHWRGRGQPLEAQQFEW